MKIFKIQNYIKSHAKWFLLTQFGIALETLIELQIPLLMATIIDKGVLQGDMELIKEYSFIISAALIASGLSIMLFAYSSIKASNNVATDIRLDSFNHVLQIKVSQLQKINSASIITRLTNDINTIQDSINLILRMSIRAPLQFCGGIIMLLFLNKDFALILTFALIIEVAFVYFIMKKTQPIYEIIQKGLDGLNTISQENIVGTRTVKAFTTQENERKRFSKVNDEVAHSLYRVQRLLGSLGPIFFVVMNITLAILIYIGSLHIDMQNMEVGEIMATVTYLTQILFALMMLSMIFPNISKMMISLKRINEIFQLEIEQEKNENENSYNAIKEIEFRNVSFAYAEKKEESKDNKEENTENKLAVEDINISIKQGEKIAILGATGAGKTTLMNLLFGIYKPLEGEILINNLPIDSYNMGKLREKIALVSQKAHLFNGSIHKNITLGNQEFTDEEIEIAMKSAKAFDFIHENEEKLERELGSKGVGLSGGQRQRINLARAFLKRANILILDDCTSALDLKTEQAVHQSIKENDRHDTIILIAQKVITVQDADRIYVMNKGKIVDFGTHDELLENSNVYQEICISQDYQKDLG